ncbi:RHOD [Musa troglodytarum]|uniref:RHOD n=1 Tax=Musa troglodytarum TaxID=320322 RepID=A0A9E7EX03_9LILI|nr:RHOD [Musa troglodytarum]URD84275.1 RHOD [Musa troglodytarum]
MLSSSIVTAPACLLFCPYRESWKKKRRKFLFSAEKMEACDMDSMQREREGREVVEERTHASEFKEVEGVGVAFKSPDNPRRKTGCSINKTKKCCRLISEGHYKYHGKSRAAENKGLEWQRRE